MLSPCGPPAVLGPPPPATPAESPLEQAPPSTVCGGPPPKAMPKTMKAELASGLRSRSNSVDGITTFLNLTEPQPSVRRTAPTAVSTPPRPATAAHGAGTMPAITKPSSAQQITTPPRGDRLERDGPKSHVANELKQRAKTARRELAGRGSEESRRRVAAQRAHECDVRPRQLFAEATKRGRRRGLPLPPHSANRAALVRRRRVPRISIDRRLRSAAATGHGGAHASYDSELVLR